MRIWIQRPTFNSLGLCLVGAVRALAFTLVAAFVSACSGAGNSQLAAGGLGITVQVASGNKQTSLPQQLFKAPISVKVLDPQNGTGVPGTPISFAIVGASDASIQTSTATTDSSGVASTFVKAQSAYGTSVTIQASITGTSTSTTFTLSTTQKGAASTYALDSTNHLTETAGVPFTFKVQVLNADGGLATSFTQTVNLFWAVQSNKSWSGSQGTFPGAGGVVGSQTPYTCNFVEGECDVPGNILVDASSQTLVSVGDDNSTGLSSVYLKPVTVVAGPAAQVLIANAAGGPAANAVVYSPTQQLVRYASDPSVTFYAALADSVGNFIQNAPGTTTWSSTAIAKNPGPGNYPNPLSTAANGSIPATLAPATGASTVFTPYTTGEANLTANDSTDCGGGACATVSIPIVVDPGSPASLALSDPNGGAEIPGVPFYLAVNAVDAKGNVVGPAFETGTGGYTGNFAATFTLSNDTTSAKVSNGCNRFINHGAGDQYDDGTNCGSSGYTTPNSALQTFVAGIANNQVQTLLNFAGATPTVTISTAAANGFPSLTGTYQFPAAIQPGAADHYMLRTGAGTGANYVCLKKLVDPVSATAGVCLQANAGQGSNTYYAAQEDKGGNVLANPAVTWTPNGAYVGFSQWAPTSATNTSTFTPITAGSGTITISDGTITTPIQGTTVAAPIDHYTLTVNDGANPTGSLSVLRTFSLTIQAKDQNNNNVTFNGPMPLNIVTTGAHASPLGTAATLPVTGMTNYTATGGQVILSNLRLPNAADSVTITATDANNSNGSVSPTLIIGPPTSLALEDGPGSYVGSSSVHNLTGQTVNVTTDAPVLYYQGVYDAELNYYGASASPVAPAGAWTGTVASSGYATINATGVSTTLTPNVVGSGTLQTAYSSLAASVTINVVPGNIRHYTVVTSHAGNEAAGVPFTMTIKVYDSKGNLCTPFNSSPTLNWTWTALNSWTGVSPTLPSAVSCSFTNGSCTTPNYELVDTRYATKFSVSDATTGITGVVNQVVNVAAGNAANLVIADKPGGPNGVDGIPGNSDDATPLNNPAKYPLGAVFQATDSPASWYAYVTDSVGNYVANASSAAWSTNATALTSALSGNSGTNIGFTPNQTASGILTVTSSGLNAFTVPLIVNPGAANHLVVTTEHSQSEQAGVPFKVNVQAVDVKGNTLIPWYTTGANGYTGTFALSFSKSNDGNATLSAGPNRFFDAVQGESLWNGLIPGGQSPTASYNIAFTNGVASAEVEADLNQISGAPVTPTISVTSAAGNGFGLLSGTTPTINVTSGGVDHLMLRASPGAGYECYSVYVNNSAGTCFSVVTGATASTYYVAQEDKGGNVLGNVAATWAPGGVWTGGQWSPTSASTSSTFTATPIGNGNIAVSFGGVTSTFYGVTTAGPLDHFDVATTDGVDPANNLSVTSTHTLQIVARDHAGDAITSIGTISMNISYTGAHSSPAPTSAAPVIPPVGFHNYTFDNTGTLTLTGLALPNVLDTVTITVTDGTHSGTTINPVLIIGAPATVQIRTADANGGSSINSQTVSQDTDHTYPYYFAVYDAQSNYYGAPTIAEPSANWSGSITSLAGLTTPGSSTTESPTTTGTGVLTATYNALSASTGTITVGPGAINHIKLTSTPSSVTAGHPFTVAAQLLDAHNNIVTTAPSSEFINISATGTTATLFGNTASIPSSGSYGFTNGVMTTPLSFTLYNITNTPTIHYGITSPAAAGSIANIAIAADVPDNFIINAGAPTMAAGGSGTFNTVLADQWGNTISTGASATQAVTYSLTSSLTGQKVTATSLTGASGVNTSAVTGNLVAGAASVTVTATQAGTLSLGGTTSGLTHNHADQLQTITVTPLSTVSSVAWLTAPPTSYTASNTNPISSFTAEVLDTYGNLITSNTDPFAVSLSSGTGTLGGTLTGSVSGGTVTFANVTYPRAENITIKAKDTSANLFATQNISVTTGPAEKAIAYFTDTQTFTPGEPSLALAITGTSPARTAGVSFPVTILQVDDGYNLVNSSGGQVRYTTTDPQVTTPGYSGFVNGSAPFTVVMKTAGSGYVLTTDTGGALTATNTTAFNVNPSSLSTLYLSGPANAGAASCSTAFTVTSGDAYKNILPVPSTVTINLTGNGAGTFYQNSNCTGPVTSISIPTSSSTAQFYFKSSTTGSLTFTAADNAGNLASGTQAFTVVPAVASSVVVNGYPGTATAGTVGTVTVTLKDTFGNVATGYTGTMHFTSTDPQAVLPANYTFTGTDAGVKNFSVTLKTSGTQSITATDTVSAGLAGAQASITINPAVASQYLLSGFPSSVTAGTPGGLLVKVADAYNNLITNYTDTVHFTSTDAAALLPADYAFQGSDAGQKNFNVTLKTAGTQGFTVTDTSNALLTKTDTPITVVTQTPAKLAVSGSVVLSAGGCSAAYTVTVEDQYNNAANATSNVQVNLTGGGTGVFYSNSGCMTPITNLTIASGTSTGMFYFKDTSAQALTFSGADNAGALTAGTLGVTVNPGAATTLVAAGFANPATAGTASTLTVTAKDQYGNTVTAYNGTVAITSTDASAAIPVNHTYQLSDNGVYAFSVTLKTKGTQTLTATDTATGSINGHQSAITVNPAATSVLAVTGFTTPITAGATSSLLVTAQDAYGNTTPTYVGTAHFTSSDAQAVLPANYTFTVADAGLHTFTAVSLKTAGSSQAITATDTVTGSITGQQTPIVVNPNSGTKLVLTGPGTGFTGTCTAAYTVTATDIYGNPVNVSSNVQVNLGGAGAGAFYTNSGCGSSASSVTIASGTSAQTFYFKDSSTQTLTLTATDNAGVFAAGNYGVVISPSAVNNLLVAGFTTPTVAGVAHNVTVTARDSFNNTVPSYTGTVNFTSTDSAAGLPANYTFVAGDAGVHTFSVTLKTVGTQTITATDSGNSVNGAETAITVNPAAAATLALTAFPSSTVAGVAHNVTVTALDAFGNTATGYLGTVHFTSGDAQATLPSNYVFSAGDAGVHTFTNGVTLATAPTQAITATDTLTGTITGTENGIAVTAAAPTKLALTGPASLTVGACSTIYTITAKDQYGNVSNVTSSKTINLTNTGAGGWFTASNCTSGSTTSLSIANGTSSNTIYFQDNTQESATLTATDSVASLTASSLGISIVASPVTHFAVSGYPTPTVAGNSHNLTVQALDSFNNVNGTYVGTVHFTSSDAQFSLANYTFTGADAGTHVFSFPFKTVGTQSVTVTDTVTGTITGTQTGVAVNPNMAASLAVSGYPATTTAGVSNNATVTAKDAYGNTATGYTGTIQFSSTDPIAGFPGTYQFQSTDSGVKVLPITLKTAGSQTITATDTIATTITGFESGIAVAATTATKLAIAGPVSDPVGVCAAAYTVTSQDQYGNPSTVTSNKTINLTGGGSGGFYSASNCTGAITSVSIPNATSAGTFYFKDSSVESLTFNAADSVAALTAGTLGVATTPGTATTLLFTGYPSSSTAGVSQTTTVTLKDQYGNVATTYTGTVHFTSSDAAATLPANHTFVGSDAGSKTFLVTLKTAGTDAVTATDTVTGALNATQSSLTVIPAAATHYTIVGYPTPISAGTIGGVTVTAKDAYANTATAYTGTVAITSSDAQAVLPSNTTFLAGDNGAKNFNITFKTSGTQSFTVTDTVNATITSTSPAITVNPVSPLKLTLTGPATDAAGVCSTAYTVTIDDQYGNASNASSNVQVNLTGGGSGVFYSNSGCTTAITSLTISSGTSTGMFYFKDTSTQTLTLSTADNAGSLTTGTFGITVGPGPATTFIASGFANPATAGTASTLTVVAKDQYGNTATSYTGSVHITSSDGSATIPANYTFIASDNGSHAFSVTLKTKGTQSLTATDTVTGTITGTQSAITVNPAATSVLAVTAFPSTVTAGSSNSMTVTSKDPYGNTTPAYTGTAHFTSSDAQAVLPANYTFVGGDNGVHNFTGVILKTAGSTQAITATDTVTGTITGSETPIVVNAATGSKLALSGPTTGVTGACTAAFTVSTTDTYGNPVLASPAVQVNLTGAGSGAFYTNSGCTSATVTNVSIASGTSTQTFYVKDNSTQSLTIGVADNAGTYAATSGALTISPSPVTHLVVAGFPTSDTAGVAHNLTVTAQDAFNNTAVGYTGTVVFTSTDSAATLPGSYTFVAGDAGVHTFSVTLTTAGTQSLTAMDAGNSVNGTESAITVSPAAATTLAVSAFPVSTTAGVAHTVTVTAKDAFSNTATGYLGTVHFTSGDTQATLPANYTFSAGDAGVHNFVSGVTLATAPTQAITATDTVTGTITGAENGIAVTAATATKLVLSGPTPISAGVCSTIYTVTSEDQYGNASNVTSNKTINLTNTGSGGWYTASNCTSGSTASLSISSGSSSNTVYFKDNSAESFTLTATDSVGSLTASSLPVVANPSPVTHLSVTGYPASTIAGVTHGLTIKALDQYNNTVTSYVGTVAFTSTDGQFSLANYTFVGGDAGAHTFTVPFKTVGTQSVTATDTVTGSVNGSQTGIAVTAAAATVLAVSGYPATTTAGVSNNATVTAKDAYGNTATGYTGTIQFFSTDPIAVFPGTYQYQSSDNGVKSLPITLKTSGSQTITATDTVTGTITGLQNSIAVSAAAATKLAVTGPTSDPVGVCAAAYTITSQDPYGNAAGVTSNKTINLTGGGSGGFYSASNCTGSITSVSIPNTTSAGTFYFKDSTVESLTFSAADSVAALTTGTLGVATTPATATTLLFTGYPSSAVAGVSQTTTVTLKDQYGNVATGYTGTVHFTSSDAAATLPANYTFVGTDAGIKTFPLALKTAGTESVTATDTVTGALTATQSALTITPSMATHYTIAGYPTPISAGTIGGVTVTAKDAYANTTTGYTGTVAFTSSDAQAVLPANYTFLAGDSGAKNFNLTFRTSGTQSFTVTDTASATITSTSPAITVNPVSPLKLVLTGPSTIAAGVCSTALTVQIDDTYGNASNATSNVQVNLTGGGSGTFYSNSGCTTSITNVAIANGTSTGTFYFKDSSTQSLTLSAADNAGTLTTGTLGTVVGSGPATTLLVTGFANPATAGTASTITVVAKDQYGNTATGYTGTVHITSTDGSATIPANYTYLASDNGSHVFSVTLKTKGTQSLTATDTVTGTITGTQSAITVNPAATSILSVTGFPTPVSAGASNSLTVTAKDAFGNTTTAYTGTAHFTSSDPQAVLPSNYTFVGGDNGVHVFTGVVLKTAGSSQAITATDTVTGTITGAQSPIVVNTIAGSKLALSGPTTGVTGACTAVFTVTTTDTYGNTVLASPAVQVNLTGAGSGAFYTNSGCTSATVTNVSIASGTSTQTFYVKDNTSQSLTIGVADNAGTYASTSGALTISPSPVTHLAVAGFPTSDTSGVAHNLTVTAQDAYNNTVVGYTGTVAFTSTDGAATLPGNYTFVGGDAGVHTFSVTLNTNGTQSITATDSGNSVSGTESAITVSPAPAATLVVTAFPTSTTAGVAHSVTVTAKDAQGNVATGYLGTVHFTSGDTQATLPANYTFSAGDAGVHNFVSGVTLATGPTQAITATDTITGTITGTQSGITVTAAAASKLAWTGGPSSLSVGACSTVYSVTAEDQFGNVSNVSSTKTINLTSSGSGTFYTASNCLSGAVTSQSMTSGTSSVTFYFKDSVTSNVTLTAADSVAALTAGTLGLTIVAAPASTLVVSGYPTPTTAGASHNVTVTAKDAYGNVVTGYTGTVAITTSDTAGVLPANYTFTGGDAGVHNFAATLKTVGTWAITATDTGNGTINGTQSSIVTNPGTAATLAVTGYPSTTTAGTANSFTVTAKDSSGNVATGYVGTAHFTSTDAQASLPANYTFVSGDNGVKTVSATLKTAGTQTITATDTVTGTITGSQGSIAVNATTAAKLAVTSGPASISVGSCGNAYVVTSEDNYGNPANVTSTRTINLTGGGAGSFYANSNCSGSETSVSIANGTSANTFYFSDNTVQSLTLNVADSLSALTAGTYAVSTTPNSAASMTLTAYPTSTVAGAAHNATVTLKDSYGNTATGYTGTIHVTSSDSQATLPGNYTFTGSDAGVKNISITMGTHGTQSITATDTVTGSLTATESGITVTPGAATYLTVSGYPTLVTAGTSNAMTVTAYDVYNNVATGYTGTVTVTSTDAQYVPPANYTFEASDNGVHNLNVTLKTVGTQTITATDTVTSSIKGSEGSIAVQNTTNAKLAMLGGPTSITAGVCSTAYTVAAEDQYGNLVSQSGTVQVNLSSSGSGTFYSDSGCSSSVTHMTIGSGTSSQTFYFKDNTAQTVTLTSTDNAGSLTSTNIGVTVGPAAASQLLVTTAYPSSVTAGVAQSLTITAKDQFGNVATGYTHVVTLTSSDGQAVLPATYTFTGSDAGVHSFSVTLKTAGTQAITATDTTGGGTPNVNQGSITVGASSATTLAVTSFPSPVNAGSSNGFTVTAKDAYGNTATGYTGTAAFTSNDTQFVAPANVTFVGANNGVVNVTGAVLKTAGSKTVTATDTVTSSIKGSQSSITVNPIAATSLTVTGFANPAIVKQAYTYSVHAYDTYGNTATGYTGTVAFTTTDGAAALPANYTFTGGDAGIHSFSGTLKTLGTQSITATDTVTSSITGAQGSILVNPAAANTLVVSYPTSVTAGSANSLVVTARDTYGDLATTYTGTVAFTSSDTQAGLPSNYTFTASDAGTHTFSATLKTAGTKAITATDSGNSISGSQTGITVTNTTASKLVVSGYPTSPTAGTSQSFTVTAEDTYGNTVPTYTGQVTFTSTDTLFVAPSNYTFVAGDSGVHTFSGAVLKTAGSQSITATDTSTAITGAQTGIAVNAAGAATLALSGYANPTITHAAHNVTITAKDAYGNTATGYTGTAHLTSSDSSATLAGNYTFVAGDMGVHSLSVTLVTLGTQTITATDTVTGSITGSQGGIVVNPSTASVLALSYPTTETAGTTQTLTVTAKDAYGNTATTYTGTVAFTTNDAAATMPANYTFLSGDLGVKNFSVALKTAGTKSITGTDTVTGTITGTQTGITVSATTATVLALTGPSTLTSGTCSSVYTITAQDQYGNASNVGTTQTINLSGGSGTFYSTAGCTGSETSASIASGTSAQTFYYKDSTSESITLTAADSGFTSGTKAVTVSSGTATQLTVSGFANPATAGTSSTVTVTAKDSSGNVVTGYTGTVQITSSDTAAVLPANHTFTVGNAGVYSFSVTLKTVGTKAITATDTSTSITGSQTGITVNPGAATTLAVSYPTNTTAGVNNTLTVTAKDAAGNVATGYTGTVVFSSNDGAATMPSNYSFQAADNGVKTFSVALKTAGTKTITATDTVTGTITGSQPSITVSAATPSVLALAGPTSLTAGVCSTAYTMTSYDAYGNVSNVTSTQTINLSGGSGTFYSASGCTGSETTTTITNGTSTGMFYYKDSTAESFTMSVADTGYTSGTLSVTVSTGTATSFTVTGFANPATAGTASSVTVTAKDIGGNIVHGYTGTVQITSSDISAVLPSNYTFTGGDSGVHSFAVTLKTIGTRTITATDTSTSITGSQSGIVVNPASVSKLAVSYPGATSAGTAQSFTVTAQDTYNNTVTSFTDTVSFTTTDSSATMPTAYQFVSGDNGVHTFSGTFVTAGTQSLTATDTSNGTINGTQSGIVVSAGSAVASASSITGTGPVNADGSSTSTVTITLHDTYGNAVTGVRPTFTATDTNTTNSYGTCGLTNSSGVATCLMSSSYAESKTLHIATPVSKNGGSVTFNGLIFTVAYSAGSPFSYGTTTVASTQTFILKNVSGYSLTGILRTLSGQTSLYSYGTDNCTAAGAGTGSLAAGSTCTIQLIFNPSNLSDGGTYNANVNLMDSTGNSSATNYMTGTD